MNWADPAGQVIATTVFLWGIWMMFSPKKRQKFSDNPGSRLETFVRIAARAANKRYPDNPGKRDLTISHVVELYQEWNLPVPSKRTIELAIDAEASGK